jgi:hypothetical protein
MHRIVENCRAALHFSRGKWREPRQLESSVSRLPGELASLASSVSLKAQANPSSGLPIVVRSIFAKQLCGLFTFSHVTQHVTQERENTSCGRTWPQ